MPPKPPPPPPPNKPSHLTTNPATPSKRGLAWPWDHTAPHFAPFTPQPKISWLFNWELWRPPFLPPTPTWTPTVRTTAQTSDIHPFLTDITQNQHHPVHALLGFNEPELPSQADLSPTAAAHLWTTHVLPAKSSFNLRLGSPGMSSDTTKCKPWLDAFFSALGGVPSSGVDFLVLHYYGARVADMQRFLADMHQTYRLPIWVTEFACSRMGEGGEEATEEEVGGFMREAIPWLEACEWVERYAWFGLGQGGSVGEWVGRKNDFLEADGEGWRLTRTGKLYCEL